MAVTTFFSSVLFLFISVIACTVSAQEKDIFFREDFNHLENWDQLHFRKIKKHSQYSIEKNEAGSYLKAESNASASGIIFKREFNVFEYPRVRWSWMISNVYKKGNSKKRSGDDYPIRIYIIFKYDPGKASFTERIKYGLMRRMYGEDPPHSSLTYIWESKEHDINIITSPYASESKMIILQTGDENAGKWLEQEVDLIDDYHEAFGENPPPIVSIAIMNDSDNTGERSVSYIDFIEVFR